MSVSLPGVPTSIVEIIQDRTLERVFHDALFPRQLYRLEAMPESWAANLGEQMIFTRTGLLDVDTTPLQPGQDPVPASYATEQWSAQANQYGKTIDTHMPSSYVSLANLFLRNTQQLGLNAGQTLDRIARNKLFVSYLAGETSVTVGGGAGATQLTVASLNGFTEQLQNGRLSPVSPANPIGITFSTASEPANTVIAAIPLNPAVPLGPGVITLGAASTNAIAIRDAIYADSRSRRLRVGGGASVDSISSTNILTLDSIISAVARLRAMNVPTHGDGRYHVHLSPEAEAQIFRDNHWQRLHDSLPDSYEYRELAIAEKVGCIFFRNSETPTAETVTSTTALPGGAGGAAVAPEIGGEVLNASGLPIRRTVITGGGALYEKYIDESKYITEAGVTGKIGEFSVVNNGAQVMTNRIRLIMRAPQDRLQQIVGQTWSWSGDFAVPSDLTTGDAARYKRAVVIEHS